MVLSSYWEILQSTRPDAWLLLLSKGLRLFCFGFLSVMLVIYLREVGFSNAQIGTAFALTMIGDSCISLYLTSRADRIGRKTVLIIGCILSIITSLVFSVSSSYIILVISAIFGVISPSGNEVGPFMAVELSAVSEVVPVEKRTKVLAIYNLVGSFSSAIGALFCGYLIDMLTSTSTLSLSLLMSCRIALVIYSAIKILILVVVSFLSSDIEVPKRDDAQVRDVNPASLYLGLHQSKEIILKLSILFFMDAFAGSFIMQSLISNWFHETYGTSTETLGQVVFVCNSVAAVSALFAAELADRIGLILTMFVTHLPSNVLTILVPIMPTELTAILMLSARYSISQMDVPTRNAYVQKVVASEERSAANGILNVVRSLGVALGPIFAGKLYDHRKSRDIPFFIAGGIKIVYDFLLVWSFANTETLVKEVEQKSEVQMLHRGETSEIKETDVLLKDMEEEQSSQP